MIFEVLTLFPEAIEGFVGAGLLGKAIDKGLVEVRCTNIRDYAEGKHRTVDDAPFGGGAGMVMKPGPVVRAIEAVEAERGRMHRVLLTPSAPRFDQGAAQRLAAMPRIGLVCGRYEGIDDRVREHFVDEVLSLGDFVLGGGEVAALAVIEAVARLQEGVLGNPESVETESFVQPMLEHPQYTRPADFRGHRVPDVLLGGNHADIERWRQAQARRRTWALRPDLREVVHLPAETEVHVAVAAEAEPEPELAEVARRHRVSGLVVIGEAVLPWVEALRGRVKVTGFPSLKALRKRLRQRGGVDPWVVALGGDAGSDVRELLDALAVDAAPPGKALILALPGVNTAPGADAGFAPLASGPGIEDASRPLAALVDRTLSGLFEATP